MSKKRFYDIKRNVFYLFADLDARDRNEKWWPVLEVETSYSDKRKKLFKNESKDWIADESMSAFCPRTVGSDKLDHFCHFDRSNLLDDNDN